MIISSMIAMMVFAVPQEAARGTSPGGGMPVVKFTATGTFSDGTTRLFGVTADSDGDGVPEDMTLAVTCDGGTVTTARVADGVSLPRDFWEVQHAVKSPRDAASGLATGRRAPRDAASGLATGKRMHKPMIVHRDLAARVLGTTYDLKKGTKRTVGAAPTSVALANVDPAVCSLH